MTDDPPVPPQPGAKGLTNAWKADAARFLADRPLDEALPQLVRVLRSSKFTFPLIATALRDLDPVELPPRAVAQALFRAGGKAPDIANCLRVLDVPVLSAVETMRRYCNSDDQVVNQLRLAGFSVRAVNDAMKPPDSRTDPPPVPRPPIRKSRPAPRPSLLLGRANPAAPHGSSMKQRVSEARRILGKGDDPDTK